MLDEIKKLLNGSEVVSVKHLEADITIVFEGMRLWVDSSWRIENRDEIILGSGNLLEYLSHEDYRDNYEEAVEQIRGLISGRISEVEFVLYNDLVLKFESGYVFRTFQDYGNDAENFQLYQTNRRLLVTPQGVEIENA